MKTIKFVNAVKKEFSPSEIILSGSRANATEWKQSDFDIIIISEKFDGMHWLKRIQK